LLYLCNEKENQYVSFFMGRLLDSLKNYFENTPTDVLERDWRELAHLNDFGEDVLSYAEAFDCVVRPYAFEKNNCINDTYKENTKYYLAA